jgi:HD superfamily phosphodiesterase
MLGYKRKRLLREAREARKRRHAERDIQHLYLKLLKLRDNAKGREGDAWAKERKLITSDIMWCGIEMCDRGIPVP